MRALEVERRLADVASGQWGLITAPQAKTAGITYVRLTRMTQAGVLDRVAHGVYRIRLCPPDTLHELKAAWLALDPVRTADSRLSDGPAGAVVSHASAAALHRLGDLSAHRHEFTVPARKQSRRRDLRLHRRSLTAEDMTIAGGLPTTTAERVIVDLIADGTPSLDVARVLRAAQARGLVDLDQLGERLEPYAARRCLPERDGPGLVRRLLDQARPRGCCAVAV